MGRPELLDQARRALHFTHEVISMVICQLSEQFVGEQYSDLLTLDGPVRLFQRHFDIVWVNVDVELPLRSAVKVPLNVGFACASRSKL